MESLTTILALIAIITATGLIWTVTQSQSVDAWHSEGFESKKECVNYVKEVTRDTTRAEAEVMCEEVISHKNKK